MSETPTSKAEQNATAPSEPQRNHPHEGSRRRWVWLLLLLFCLAGAGAYWFFIGPSNGQQVARQRANAASRAIPVAVAPVRTGDIQVYLNGLGTVTPNNSVTVRTRVDGELIKVLFREGQMIKADAALAEIDPRPYQVQLTQAEGQMARDQALLKNAQVDLKRYQMLFTQDSIAKQQVDTQEALVRQYQGTVKADQGQIDNARLSLIYCHISAPIGGRLGLRQVDPGNIVHASDPNGLVVINQIQPITVVFTLSEDNLPAVLKRFQVGSALAVEAWSRDGKTKLADGTLLTVDNQIDPTTGTVKLKAEFPNHDNALFPNQFVNARLLVDTERGATVMPSAAVQRGTQGAFVYRVKEDQSVTLRPVRLGPVEGDNVGVESGLAPGDVVVVDGLDKLREGAKIEPVTGNKNPESGPEPRRPPGEPDGRPRGGARERRQPGSPPGPRADSGGAPDQGAGSSKDGP